MSWIDRQDELMTFWATGKLRECSWHFTFSLYQFGPARPRTGRPRLFFSVIENITRMRHLADSITTVVNGICWCHMYCYRGHPSCDVFQNVANRMRSSADTWTNKLKARVPLKRGHVDHLSSATWSNQKWTRGPMKVAHALLPWNFIDDVLLSSQSLTVANVSRVTKSTMLPCDV
jgi:hypothetical protein